jgi:hypothetical protein
MCGKKYFGVEHNVSVLAPHRFTFFMFICATPVAFFVLNIACELISSVRSGILLSRFVWDANHPYETEAIIKSRCRQVE